MGLQGSELSTVYIVNTVLEFVWIHGLWCEPWEVFLADKIEFLLVSLGLCCFSMLFSLSLSLSNVHSLNHNLKHTLTLSVSLSLVFRCCGEREALWLWHDRWLQGGRRRVIRGDADQSQQERRGAVLSDRRALPGLSEWSSELRPARRRHFHRLQHLLHQLGEWVTHTAAGDALTPLAPSEVCISHTQFSQGAWKGIYCILSVFLQF